MNSFSHDDHLGRILIGRIVSGTIRTGDPLKAIDREGKPIETGTSTILPVVSRERESVCVCVHAVPT